MTTLPDNANLQKSRPQSRGELRIAVIGGGAAGFFSAINTAEKNPKARITIFEAGQHPLQKVLISGGGRCNLTHACFDPVRLSEFYPRGSRELRSLFTRFQPKDTMSWFEKHRLKLKIEEDGRVFPVSDCSQDVIDLFLEQAERFRIRIHNRARVERIEYKVEPGEYHDKGQFWITAQGQTQAFDVCILSTGYSPPGWKLAESLGHRVIPPVPSLFPLTVKSPAIAGLQGISLTHVHGKLTVEQADGPSVKLQAEGPLLITHTGLSGPVIYRLSAWGAQALAKNRYHASIQLDLLPERSEDSLRSHLTKLFQAEAKKKIANTQLAPLSHRLWLSILEHSGLDTEERCEVIGKKALNRLIENLKRLQLPVSGKSPSKEEFVSCGGVSLKEVDFKTMQSRKVPGLFFGGEILDIDALTGGFNFQACWSAGWTISETLKSFK